MHSPGPWNIQGIPPLHIRDANNNLVLNYCSNTKSQRECEDNVRLIAAAPELLQMLRDLIASPSLCSVSALELSRAENLIARAEGV